MKSDYEHVKEFTEGTGHECPKSPVAMTKEQVMFISKMILDEVMELTATVCGPEESKKALKDFIDNSKDIPQENYDNDDEFNSLKVSSQVDGLSDIYYYMLNAATKVGQDMSAVFKVVHAANMDKRDPETGKFIKREDGKILKRKGWVPPDVRGEILRQIRESKN